MHDDSYVIYHHSIIGIGIYVLGILIPIWSIYITAALLQLLYKIQH